VLSCHAALRDPVELSMDERDQALEGTLVAPAPFEQQRGDFRRVFRNPAILCSYLRRVRSDLPGVGILTFRRWEGLRTDGVANRGCRRCHC